MYEGPDDEDYGGGGGGGGGGQQDEGGESEVSSTFPLSLVAFLASEADSSFDLGGSIGRCEG